MQDGKSGRQAGAGAVRTVLVIGASGTVGREVVRALVEQAGPPGAARLRALVRSPARAAALPARVERVVGDVADRASLAQAVRGADAVFYVSPHAADEEALCENVVAACEAAGARLVFLGVHADGRSRLARWAMRQVFGRVAPHYRAKLRLSERARRSRTAPVLLLPSTFCQNEDLFREELLAGTFPSPLSAQGMNRVDVRDVGDAAARALLEPDFAPGAYPLVGPATLNGPACAAAWGAALGRPVAYTGADGRWEQLVEARLEGRKREDFLGSLRLMARFHLPTRPAELARTTALLGRPPRSYADYARDTAARWLRERAA
jgi:uncharacterized protein YbjT (DUF2867 family)